MFDRLRLKTKGYVVRDNFLPLDMITEMRNFAIYEPTITASFSDGYVAKDYDRGEDPLFTATRLAEFIKKRSSILRYLKYSRAWSFVYDDHCSGVGPHADHSKIQVNLWVTPNKCMDSKDKNGLLLYKREVPKGWTWEQYNGNQQLIQHYLRHSKFVRIPYKFNRAVIFPGKTFHATDDVSTIPGLKNSRVNYTFLYD